MCLIWLIDSQQVHKHDAATSLEEFFNLPQHELYIDYLIFESIRVWTEGCLICKFDNLGSDDALCLLVALTKALLNILSWPNSFFIFSSYDALYVHVLTSLSLIEKVCQAYVLIELCKTLSVIYKRITSSLVLGSCFDHDTAYGYWDSFPSITNDSQRNLIRVRWMQFEENLSNSIIM